METLQRTANRGSLATGYDIDNSLKLEADNGEVLTQTIGAGSRTTATYSFWFKRTELGADMQLAGISPIGSETTRFIITSNDVLDVESGVGGDNNSLVTNRVFRDTSAWYHFVVAIDTTQSTEANRVKVYVNGVQETSFSASEYPAQNTNLTIGVSGYTWSWGAYSTTQIKSSGYLAEAYYIDAQQLDPTSFGKFDEDTGIWKPIAYTGSFGSNGHYLDFSDASDLGNNSSGVGNDFTLNNITSADQATDTPTNNFATLNPLQATSYYTLKEGGTVLEPSQSGWGTGVSSIGVTSGKWYFEERSTATDRTTMYGIVNESDVLTLQGDKHVGDGVYSVGFYGNTAQVFSNGSVIATYNIFNQNQLVACALDLDNGKVYFAIQNTWQNSADPANGTGGISLPTGGSDTYFFGVNGYFSDNDVKTNHGGYTIQTPDSAASDENGYGTFEFAPPSGYYALCTKNLAEYG